MQPLFDFKQRNSNYVCYIHKALGHCTCTCMDGRVHVRRIPTLEFINSNRLGNRVSVVTVENNTKNFSDFNHQQNQVQHSQNPSEHITQPSFPTISQNAQFNSDFQGSNFPELSLGKQQLDSHLNKRNMSFENDNFIRESNENRPVMSGNDDCFKKLLEMIQTQGDRMDYLANEIKTLKVTNAQQKPPAESQTPEDWSNIFFGDRRELPSPEIEDPQFPSKEINMVAFDINKGQTLEEFLEVFESLAAKRHPKESFPIVLEKYLTGRTLRTYKQLSGARLTYKVLKERLHMALKPLEQLQGLPIIPDEVKYIEGEPIFTFLMEISTHLVFCKDQARAEEATVAALWSKLPQTIKSKLEEKALKIAGF